MIKARSRYGLWDFCLFNDSVMCLKVCEPDPEHARMTTLSYRRELKDICRTAFFLTLLLGALTCDNARK